jgi:hypothetical protein
MSPFWWVLASLVALVLLWLLACTLGGAAAAARRALRHRVTSAGWHSEDGLDRATWLRDRAPDWLIKYKVERIAKLPAVEPVRRTSGLKPGDRS